MLIFELCKVIDMVKIGQWNTLRVSRAVDFGVYLDGGVTEILLPARYVDESVKVGEPVDVFIYNDSEDRLVATTEHPFATVGEVAFLEVKAVDRIGAFLDWGLMKDLLVPFREQKTTMRKGRRYPVYVYLDDASKRIVASAKIEKFLGNVIPAYAKGDKVRILTWRSTPVGMSCVVDNLHQGMLYANETFRDLEPGMALDAWVNRVRPDGKIDLLLRPIASGRQRTHQLADEILERLTITGGRLPFTDKSDQAEIKAAFSCSKRDFKQAVGHLLKDGKITLSEAGIALLEP